jgi:hypothetical protein
MGVLCSMPVTDTEVFGSWSVDLVGKRIVAGTAKLNHDAIRDQR